MNLKKKLYWYSFIQILKIFNLEDHPLYTNSIFMVSSFQYPLHWQISTDTLL